MLEVLDTDVSIDGGGATDDDASSPGTARLSPSGPASCRESLVKSGMQWCCLRFVAISRSPHAKEKS
jgi:hypothetical protein